MSYKAIILGFLFAVARFLYREDKDIDVTERTVASSRLPESFDGFKIIHVSDFHNAFFGRQSRHLLDVIRRQKGDVILMTGDVIDRRIPNFTRAVNFIHKLTKILPAYYVTGNHEAHYTEWMKLKAVIDASGMKDISNDAEKLYKGRDYINLVGIHDPWFFGYEGNPFILQRFRGQLVERIYHTVDEQDFSILMAHRPEYFNFYNKLPVDLVLSGHAHGGQIRLPYIKGLYAPHQGVLPKYSEGVHNKKDTTLSISRGVGNSRFPFRVFNHPEIIVLTLERES